MRDYLFDLGQVLLHWNPEHFFEKHMISRDEQEHLFREVFTPEWRDRSDIYLTVSENVRILAKRMPACSHIITMWDRDFFDIMHGVIEENWLTVRSLQNQGSRVFGLANFATDKFAEAKIRFPELLELDDVLISSDACFRKPEPGIFAAAITRFKLSPPNTVFVDDSPENVKAGSEAGFITHLYKDPPTLRAFIEQTAGTSV